MDQRSNKVGSFTTTNRKDASSKPNTRQSECNTSAAGNTTNQETNLVAQQIEFLIADCVNLKAIQSLENKPNTETWLRLLQRIDHCLNHMEHLCKTVVFTPQQKKDLLEQKKDLEMLAFSVTMAKADDKEQSCENGTAEIVVHKLKRIQRYDSATGQLHTCEYESSD